MNKDFLKAKKYITNNIYIKKAFELHLNLEEFLMLTYFENALDSFLDIKKASDNLNIPLDKAYQVFNSLVSKKIISVKTTKDLEGRMIEEISLDNFYNMLLEDSIDNQKQQVKSDIYTAFERDFFGRTINNIEYEYINAWLEKGFKEELILEALKEAVYNGVNSLRYIDKILFEWQKKGFQTKEDVAKHLRMHSKEKEEDRKELFDYNWLEDEE